MMDSQNQRTKEHFLEYFGGVIKSSLFCETCACISVHMECMLKQFFQNYVEFSLKFNIAHGTTGKVSE